MKKEYYCGARWFPLWLRKWLSKYHNNSCKIHDQGYKKGGSKETRLIVDTNFLINMIKEAPNKVTLASIYYQTVRLFGWLRFK